MFKKSDRGLTASGAWTTGGKGKWVGSFDPGLRGKQLLWLSWAASTPPTKVEKDSQPNRGKNRQRVVVFLWQSPAQKGVLPSDSQ